MQLVVIVEIHTSTTADAIVAGASEKLLVFIGFSRIEFVIHVHERVDVVLLLLLGVHR